MTAKPFDDAGRYVIEDYSSQRPFSSFLPGIAGPMGVPLWAFYVNRGQGIASFGIGSKDSPLLEFQPANKAYQLSAVTGFRTFLKYRDQDQVQFFEPFASWSDGGHDREMHIGLNELEIVENNHRHGLRTSVLYYTLPEEPLAGLVRQLRIRNISNKPIELEILDGLPQLVPYGADNGALKHVGRTIEAWMRVENVEQALPFYRLRASAADHARVSIITAGHFALGWENSEHQNQRLPVIVDPHIIFRQETSFHTPQGFLDAPLAELLDQPPAKSGKTPCAFFGLKRKIKPGESIGLASLYGHCSAFENLEGQINQMTHSGWLIEKRDQASEIVHNLVRSVQTHTSSALFDAYVQQTFLDNTLRGGWPVTWRAEPTPHVFHIYTRKHGDLERDYNDFHLAPEFYSCGEGNYRDVNQNRRNDVFFNPRIGTQNIRDFLSLIQLDGYNPLVVKGRTFTLPPDVISDLSSHVEDPAQFDSFVKPGFTPGGLLKDVRDHQLDLDLPPQEFLSQVMKCAESELNAEFGEGFWVDHWTYILDQIESYLAVYPDRKTQLLYEGEGLPYYRSPVRVLPRSERYVLTAGGPRQYHALATHGTAGWVQTPTGDVLTSTVFEKLVLLAGLKFGTLDPGGMGVEMEAGKPGWYDALNGLPALFGSSLPESYELLRLIKFLRKSLGEGTDHRQCTFPVEFVSYIKSVVDLTKKEEELFQWWQRANVLREKYREQIYDGITGKEIALSGQRLDNMLSVLEARVREGLDRADSWSKQGLAPTYFRYEAVEYHKLINAQDEDLLDPQGHPYLEIKSFQPQPLPLFLEGAVRAMKVAETKEEARAIHEAVRSSSLFDRKLKMYKLNAPLEDQSHQIGRARAFTPGWLENESIWLHMEYKYLLELLKAGLYPEFFEEFRDILIPFQHFERYGRSPLENSSFLVSSAHPQHDLHGAGFVARLTGATAEFIHMWLLMMVGKRPFRQHEGELELKLQPALPAWMFDEENQVSFQFLGHTAVTYHNPRRINTWEDEPARVEIMFDNGERNFFSQGKVSAPYAEMARDNQVSTIDIYFS